MVKIKWECKIRGGGGGGGRALGKKNRRLRKFLFFEIYIFKYININLFIYLFIIFWKRVRTLKGSHPKILLMSKKKESPFTVTLET